MWKDILKSEDLENSIVEILRKEGGAADFDKIYEELKTKRTERRIKNLLSDMVSAGTILLNKHGYYVTEEFV